MIDFATNEVGPSTRLSKKSQRGGSVMIGVDNAQLMAERLAERRVFVDWRPGAGLRMSPHFFNTDEEIEEALNILAGLIK